MAATPPLPATFRPYLARRVIAVLAVVVAVVIGLVAVALPEGRDGAPGFSTSDRVGMVAVALIALAGLWLLNRPRIRADESGLQVTNVFRSRHLDWAEVVDVSLRPNDPWLVFDLDDGTTLAAMGVQTSDGKRARAAADQVRELVAARTTTPTDN